MYVRSISGGVAKVPCNWKPQPASNRTSASVVSLDNDIYQSSRDHDHFANILAVYKALYIFVGDGE